MKSKTEKKVKIGKEIFTIDVSDDYGSDTPMKYCRTYYDEKKCWKDALSAKAEYPERNVSIIYGELEMENGDVFGDAVMIDVVI